MVVAAGFLRKIFKLASALALTAGLGLGTLGAAPAAAQQNVYVAAGIPVDITGDLATLREQAMLKAQREGLMKVLSTIASADDVKAVTLPNDDTITSWVQDFEIEEEKTSASRYIGRFTFRFMAAPIRQFLAAQGVAYAETETKAVQARADRYAVADVMVAEAALQPPGADGKRVLALNIASYGSSNVQNIKDQVVSDSGDVDQLLRDGVAKVAELVQNSWKQDNLVDPNSRATVQVHVPFSTQQQWVQVKRHLAQVNLIKSVNLTRLSRSGADLELTYLGDEEQFIRALNQADLAITSSGEGLQTMTLSPGGLGSSTGSNPDLTQ